MMNCILHIDDDDDDLEFFRMAIEDLDIQINCISMKSAREALKKIITKEILPDIIFTDLNIPKMDGFQFLEEISNLPNSIPVVALSTSSQNETWQKVMSCGAKGCITKPISIKEFSKLILQYV